MGNVNIYVPYYYTTISMISLFQLSIKALAKLFTNTITLETILMAIIIIGGTQNYENGGRITAFHDLIILIFPDIYPALPPVFFFMTTKYKHNLYVLDYWTLSTHRRVFYVIYILY